MIPGAPASDDPDGGPARGELASKVADVNLEGMDVGLVVPFPDLAHDCRPGRRPPVVLREGPEHLPFLQRQVEHLAVNQGRLSLAVDGQVTDRENLGGPFRGPPHQGPNPGSQGGNLEWFTDEVVGPGVEAHDLICDGVPGRDQDGTTRSAGTAVCRDQVRPNSIGKVPVDEQQLELAAR